MILGLVGQKGAGKDTVADYLVREHGFTKLAFADPVKKVCEAMFALESNYFHCPLLKEQVISAWGMSPREMMQKVGTDIVRVQMGDRFWIKHMQYRLDSLQQGTNVVISDVRFVNEAEFIQSLPDSHLVRVQLQATARSSVDNHISETDQNNIMTNHIINNDMSEGGLNNLYRQCDSLVII
jgi:hypothetical protein